MSGQPFAQRQGSPVLTDTAAGVSVCVPGEDTEVPGRRDVGHQGPTAGERPSLWSVLLMAGTRCAPELPCTGRAARQKQPDVDEPARVPASRHAKAGRRGKETGTLRHLSPR